MSGNEKIVYWDTGIFLTLLTGEERDPAERFGIQEQIKKFDAGGLKIITSVLTVTEVLRSQLPSDAAQKFTDLRKTPMLQFVNVTMQVANLAHDIRDYYSKHKEIDEIAATITTPDAIHVATAITNKCQTLYTLDYKDRPKKNRSLISLNGSIADGKHQLSIKKPSNSIKFQPKLPGMITS
jgi:predicted nucleic acid-binding protein